MIHHILYMNLWKIAFVKFPCAISNFLNHFESSLTSLISSRPPMLLFCARVYSSSAVRSPDMQICLSNCERAAKKCPSLNTFQCYLPLRTDFLSPKPASSFLLHLQQHFTILPSIFLLFFFIKGLWIEVTRLALHKKILQDESFSQALNLKGIRNGLRFLRSLEL